MRPMSVALLLVASAQFFIRWRRGLLDGPRVVLAVGMAYEFSAALRASGALMARIVLTYGVASRVENSLAALRAFEIPLRSHA